jgi:hypothetical protein
VNHNRQHCLQLQALQQRLERERYAFGASNDPQVCAEALAASTRHNVTSVVVSDAAAVAAIVRFAGV